MSKNFNKAVANQFHAGMCGIAGFEAVTPPRDDAWPGGERAYRKAVSTTNFWVSLIMSVRGANEFGVEVGWSFLGRYPRLNVRPNLSTFGAALVDAHDEAFLRLRPLCGSRTDTWTLWNPDDMSPKAMEKAFGALGAEESAELAAPLVSDALQCIATKGLELADLVLSRRKFANRGLLPIAAGAAQADAVRWRDER